MRKCTLLFGLSFLPHYVEHKDGRNQLAGICIEHPAIRDDLKSVSAYQGTWKLSLMCPHTPQPAKPLPVL